MIDLIIILVILILFLIFGNNYDNVEPFTNESIQNLASLFKEKNGIFGNITASGTSNIEGKIEADKIISTSNEFTFGLGLPNFCVKCRALVKDKNAELSINYKNDYTGGVVMNGGTNFKNALTVPKVTTNELSVDWGKYNFTMPNKKVTECYTISSSRSPKCRKKTDYINGLSLDGNKWTLRCCTPREAILY